MAEPTSDLPAAPSSGGVVPAPASSGADVAASQVAADAVAAPPATDAIGKADDITAIAGATPATTAGSTAPADEPVTDEKGANEQADAVPSTTSDVAAATNGTPKSTKKDTTKRKSSSYQPKGGNLKKQKSMRELHLDVKPGQIWYVRMKGYPNWPAIVCDLDMLPATLLEKRPVSAARSDGSYREDYMDGGKNARDRRYPVMFLGTNEFYWQVNTDLLPLDIQEIKDEVASGERGKRTVKLWEAYQIAAQEHDLDHFKTMLKNHEEQVIQEAQAQAERDAAKKEKEAEKAARKEARKSKGDAEDVEMGNTEESAKKKKTPSKKRKEPADGEVEDDQKGPKKIKIKTKPADDADTESAKKKKEKKPKTKKDEAAAKPAEPELTEQQKLDKKEKNVLFLRHKLQKGFLSRDVPPKEDEMSVMNDHVKQLEQDPNLEVSIIRNTKINKVMKAILKLPTIPKEDTYHFKDRSSKLLATWNAILGTPAETVTTPTAESKPVVNGDSHIADASKAHGATPAEKDEPVETKTDLGNAAGDEGDVAKSDAVPAPATSATEQPTAETAAS